MTRLEFRLVVANALPAGVTRAQLLHAGTRLAVLEWPMTLAAEGFSFVCDNLLTPRFGSPHATQRALARGYASVKSTPELMVTAVLASERTRFLADKPAFLPEPPQALAEALDLEDFVAEFGVMLRALRAAPPEQELVMLIE